MMCINKINRGKLNTVNTQSGNSPVKKASLPVSSISVFGEVCSELRLCVYIVLLVPDNRIRCICLDIID